MLPNGYDSYKDYIDHLKLRERLLLGDRRPRDEEGSFQMEYLQGIDSTGYSYHHGNLKGATYVKRVGYKKGVCVSVVPSYRP